jgi:inhibitor of cysteine peptidase
MKTGSIALKVFTAVFVFLTLTVLATVGQIQLSEKDNGQTIKLVKGDTLEIMLKGNPTTGYGWSIDLIDKSVIQMVEENYKIDNERVVGSGGVYSFLFEVVAPGDTTLRLIYSRPFEKDVPPVEVFEIKVEVGA